MKRRARLLPRTASVPSGLDVDRLLPPEPAREVRVATVDRDRDLRALRMTRARRLAISLALMAGDARPQ